MQKHPRRLLSLFALSLFSFIAPAQAAEVVSLSPQGSVKKVQQVLVRFSSDMVAMGDPRSLKDPLKVECKAGKTKTPAFKTRWADNRNWSLDFDKPLPAGFRCTLKATEELKDLAGNSVNALPEYIFSTAGPALLGVAPIYGRIEPEQYFVALTDGPLDLKSVNESAYFEVTGMPDKVRATVITAKNREAILEAAIKDNWRWREYKKLKKYHAFIILGAARRFPEDAQVVLHWPKGVKSQSGLSVEEEQTFEFQVVPKFEATFACERTAPERPCNPILDMRLNFSNRLPLASLKGTKLTAGDGKSWTPVEIQAGDQNKNVSTSVPGMSKGRVGVEVISNFEDQQVSALTFKGPFPERTKFKLSLPANLKDELGRGLDNQKNFPLETATDDFSPLLKFAAPFGILELNADPILPVSVRNLEKQINAQQVVFEGKTLNTSKMKEIVRWYTLLNEKEFNFEKRNTALLSEKEGAKFQVQKPTSERDFELLGVPLKKPGFYVVEMNSARLGESLTGRGPMFVATGALVTDMAVHLKKGRETSLVWVTQLSNAKPVARAQVTLITQDGKELAKGLTDASGLLRIGRVAYPCAFDTPRGDEAVSCEVFAFAQKEDDISFASSEWSKGIESYRFNTPTEYLSKQWGPYVMHTVLDRMAAQPGEAVNMKHFVREHQSNGFGMMKDARLPKRVLVVHQGSQKTFTLPFDFDKSTGTATGKFTIPKDAALGTYTIYLSNVDKMPSKEGDEPDPFDWSAQQTGSFVVAEYRLPLMKGNVSVQGRPLIAPPQVKVDLSASYLSGGPARGLKVKLRSTLSRGYFAPTVSGGRDFTFYSDPIKVGVFSSEREESADEAFLKVQDLTLSQDGGTAATISGLPKIKQVQNLMVEMEYTDPNGEVKTSATNAPLYPADTAIGLRTENWVAEPGKVKVSGIIVNTEGKPQANKDFKVEAFRSEYITHRKRLVGGFYSYDSKNEVKSLGKVCEGKTSADGEFKCEPKGLPAGSVTLQATTTDASGRMTVAQVSVSVFEEGADSWWAQSDSDRIDLLPTKPRFEPGEKATFVLRTPYPTATVLMTVEREGVLDSFVTEVRRDKPIVEVPMRGYYAPNIYVSALLVRGRVGAPQPTGLLDLAKPAMKMGISDLNVGWRDHELVVEVKTDKQKYKTGEKVETTIQVKAASGAPLPTGAEVVIAAVDEALMRLKDNTSWKLLTEMMGHRDLAVVTSSGQNQVIGRRHFGSKAKAPGGGGGRDMASDNNRENFDPILLWSPRVKLDANGSAKISIKLNDSISSFRIVAVAAAGTQFFGDGKASIETSKDLILYSGFSPLMREGDQIRNAFTVRNTTAKPMKVEFDISSKQIPQLAKLPPLQLGANEAKTIDLPMTVPSGSREIVFQLKAKDSVSGSQDSLTAKVRVEPAVPERVLQATLLQLEKAESLPVKQASDALPDRGGLRVSARSSLVQGLASVKSYMESYNYTCLEQKLSTSLVLENRQATSDLIQALPSYLDSQGLLKFFPSSVCGSAQLSRYVMNILDENGFDIPQATRAQLTRGLTQYVQGQNSCRSWWDDLVRDPYTSEARILALETLSRYKSFTPAPLTSLKITPNLWKTETVTAWYRLLKRETKIPKRNESLKQAETILRSRVNFQGSLMNLQGDLDWEGQWRLFTSRDQEALGVFSLFIEEPTWGQDVGRMARGIVARLKLGHWDTTMANAWGITQMRRFSAKFEKEKVTGETRITVAEMKDSVDWKKNPNGEKKMLAWPKESKSSTVHVKFEQVGTGKPWVQLEIVSAIPLKAPLDVGYQVSRKVTPVTQAMRGQWKTGDVANVEVTITAKTDQAWVVIRDPLPAGASHLGTGLSGSSNILDRAPKKKPTPGDVLPWPAELDEKSFASFTSYAAYLPRGTYTINYRVRLNSAGEFKMPPTRVEAMYAPETFGESPNANWKVAN